MRQSVFGRDTRPMFVEKMLRVRLGRQARQRELWQRRIDREWLERFVVVPRPERQEPAELRAVLELRVAGDAHRLCRVRRPERHAAAARERSTSR